ncbi:MAG TPA: response regulator [Methanospirillum sp.]|nr:response regulator [Methanospirillum sp.]
MSAIILIVDDEPALNELFVIGLKKYGFVTEGVLGGKECLDLLKDSAFKPDLILLDMMMEPMDGWETLHHIKNDTILQNIPVVMQTGKNLTYKEAEQFSYHIEDYIMKPITPKKCIDYINSSLEKARVIHTIIENGIHAGLPIERVMRLASLYRAIDVSQRLLKILEERYGSGKNVSDPDEYGPHEYQAFMDRIQIEYKQLSSELGLSL